MVNKNQMPHTQGPRALPNPCHRLPPLLGAKVRTWQSVMIQPRFGLVCVCLKCFKAQYSAGMKSKIYLDVIFIKLVSRQTKSEILT